MKSHHVVSCARMMKAVRNNGKRCAWILVLMLILTACGGTTVPAWQEQYDLGMQYLTDGDYEAAVVAFTAAIETGPKLAALYIARGDAYSAWAEETEAAALEALAGGKALEWSEITVSVDDGSTYTLEELYENAISDYEEAIRLLENGEALDDSQDELLEEADEKRQETEDRFEEGREKYTEKWNELNSSDDDTLAQADGTGNSEEDESEEAVEPKPGKTVDFSLIYKSYEDCFEEEQSVLAMLVDAAESGDLDSLPLLSEIPEVTGYYYVDGYRVHITRGYDRRETVIGDEICRDSWPYMIVSVRPQSGMGYAYYIWEDYDGSSFVYKISPGAGDDGIVYRKTDYIACFCEDWNWNGEYTETYLVNTCDERYEDTYNDSGYETGSVTDNLLNGIISTTVTTFYANYYYTWTRVYEDGIIVDKSGTEGGWNENYVWRDVIPQERVLKYFWLDEAYFIIREYDSNNNLTGEYAYNSAGELIEGELYSITYENGKLIVIH